MPRRRKASGSDTTRSRYERSRKSRRVVQKQPANAERRLHTRENIVGKALRRSRDSVGSTTRRIRARLRDDRIRNRRDPVQTSRKTAARGLPEPALSLVKTNAIAHRKQMPATPCARKKQERRAVIIAKGFGGINRARQYRSHRKCR